MCSPSPIVITPNSNSLNPPNSASAVYNHQQDPQIRKRTYSSQELKSLDNTKHSTGKNPKPRLVPYKAIAMIRMLRINQKPITSRHNRFQWLRQKGIDRINLQNIFISEDTVPKPNTQCEIATINAESVRNKDTLLTQEIMTNNIDVTLITETWLNDTPQNIAWLHQSDLLQAGYAISTHNRPTRGGGFALLYKDNMKMKKIEAQQLCTIEYAIWHVSIKNKTIHIPGIYHPPPKQHLTKAIFLDELLELLTTRLPNIENAIILGDFNIHIEDTNDYNSKMFVDTLEALGLKQHITEPTHHKGNILDLIFTETASQIKVSEHNMPDFISDHRLISATISVEKDVPKITRKKIRNYNNVSPAAMMENFHPALLSLNTNTNEAQTQLTIQLQEMLDKCVREKIIKRPRKVQNLWFNDILWQQHKIVKNRERIWRKYVKQHHWKA